MDSHVKQFAMHTTLIILAAGMGSRYGGLKQLDGIGPNGEIIMDYSNTDYDYLEVYPKKGELSNESNFKGPLELYKRYDFKINKEYDNYYVMRKRIK